ncbi:MAG: flagellar M-ring protein FliF [Hyphomicrobiales bacterium]|nr:flagellar M-ring protein FliF [Hyphomicrobiales bacterium]
MNYKKQFEILLNNLNALDLSKKIGLGVGLFAVFFGIMAITTFLNKPTTVPLYSSLSRQDINSISRVLSENGFVFVVSHDSGSVNVAPGTVADARMILAEYGLPASPESGYELFDNVNSLGLTSFMQEVTNKRAIQGELARTIQMIAGVKSARVHLVMPNKKIFRRKGNDAPSASLVLKTTGVLPAKSVRAIRHMVAAAVPGLETERVTIVSANGTLMTSSGDQGALRFSQLSELESTFEQEAERKISSALGAHLGSANFRVTVSAKLNSDQRRTDETIYDPESRVERSVQIVREKGTAENNAAGQATTITQNLPEEPSSAVKGQSSQENSEKREELTNYEINKKKVSVISDGYQVEKLSVALVVDAARISAILGNNPGQADMDAKILELENIVSSALALSKERGDIVKVSVMEFLPEEIIGLDEAEGGFIQLLGQHFGSMINALGLILGFLILALLGLRPLISFLQRERPSSVYESIPSLPGADPGDGNFAIPSEIAPGANDSLLDASMDSAFDLSDEGVNEPETNLSGTGLADISAREERVREQLGAMISQSEERVAGAIKQWISSDEASTI